MLTTSQRYFRIGVWGLVILPILLYATEAPTLIPGNENLGGHSWSPRFLLLSQLSAISGVSALSTSFLLSSRFRPLEYLLGGLDKIYRLHHKIGIAAFVLLIAHPLFFSLRFVPDRWQKALEIWLPFHREFAVNVGVITFWLFMLLILVTLIRRIPYNIWKQTHRLMGLVLIGGGWHFLTVTESPGKSVAHLSNPLLQYYLICIVIAGVCSFLYKEIWIRYYRQYEYRITKVNRLTKQTMKIRLQPVGIPLEYQSGQFAFARFDQPGLSAEQHPFTLTAPPQVGEMTITVKILGDYTRRLYDRLEEGRTVWLEGPYGEFTYRGYPKNQIWLAGGIGITPFVCWLQELYLQNTREYEIDLYYCAHAWSQMVYRRALVEWAKSLEGVNVHMVCTGEEGRLTADDIKWPPETSPEVFICGPRSFVGELKAQLIRRGIAADRIHHEEFDFR